MALLKSLQKKIQEILRPYGVDETKVRTELTKDIAHGEVTTNAAMVFCKELRVSPYELANEIIAKIRLFDEVTSATVVGAGFINITLRQAVWVNELREIVLLGSEYAKAGFMEKFGSEMVHIEFVSANPTGPMHTGHVRNAVLGDTIAALLEKVGYKVYREYYVNDAGGQVDCLARSTYLRYLEALENDIPPEAFNGDVYPGEYLIQVGKDMAVRYGDTWIGRSEQEWLPIFRTFSVNAMMALIKNDLAELGIIMDCYVSEKSLVDAGKIESALRVLESNGDIYTGVLTPPKGRQVDDWEERPQTLFRSTKYGDEIDRPLKKSDGSWTYFAGDIAYHLDKYERGFMTLINVLGADHCGYVQRLEAAVSAVTAGNATLEVKLFQIVNFFEDGVPVKMSKRAGNFITSSDVVGRVGKDATRFMMISKHNSTVIDFDFNKVIELSKDNPIFYIQYAHARICSVFRLAENAFHGITTKIMEYAKGEDIRLLTKFPESGFLEEDTSLRSGVYTQPQKDFGAATSAQKSRAVLDALPGPGTEATNQQTFCNLDRDVHDSSTRSMSPKTDSGVLPKKPIEVFSDAEISMIRNLAAWPRVVEQAAINREPHRITNYLYAVAAEFHCLWNMGRSDTMLRFLDTKDEKFTKLKLFLLSGVATILRDGLELIGISPIEEMR
jgi:arginyl-tRNA synthetase